MDKLGREPWTKGCLQVYTGDGKGKTTAAFGLALRAIGRGLRVYVGQFMKGVEYGELWATELLKDELTIEQFGSPECIPYREKPAPEDLELARQGIARAREILASSTYDIVIMDEINVAVYYHLITEAELLELVDSRPDKVELVCTGRYAPSALIDRADIVTEMRLIKHPYETEELPARDGIER